MSIYKPAAKVVLPNRTWPDTVLTKAPTWCSVDLRDGNQSLPDPMGIEAKLEFFALLCQIGFKEIEIGFPSANDTEYEFCRQLIEGGLIPDDVTIQVLVQARNDLIDKTITALAGSKRAIIHLYNSTNPAQRKIVFQKSKDEVVNLATAATQYIADKVKARGETDWILQYSPESFSLTELEFAKTICNQVSTTWLSSGANGLPIILNLPATVEASTPNVYADQIEWMSQQLAHRKDVILSVHTHNDRGTGVAATELALQAGATRVEGTLFGNGERTGNVDIVTLALNLHTQGISHGLDLHNLPAIAAAYTKATGMEIPPRHPYAGELVFTAFSGGHQDAITKGMEAQKEDQPWEVPYLTINPKEIGREYEPIIRINSQSGKGGLAHIVRETLGLKLPKPFQIAVGQHFKEVTDSLGREISLEEITSGFNQTFVNVETPLGLVNHETINHEGRTTLAGTFKKPDGEFYMEANGTGPLDALAKILKVVTPQQEVTIADYQEHSRQSGNNAQAVAYIQLGDSTVGIGIDFNIETAALKALLCAHNRRKN